MNKYILNKKSDLVFKELFDNEKPTKVLISFLNDIIKPEHQIHSVEISNIDKEYFKYKYSRLYIKAITNNDEFINIVLQVINSGNVIDESLYYWGEMFKSQVIKCNNYAKLSKKYV